MEWYMSASLHINDRTIFLSSTYSAFIYVGFLYCSRAECLLLFINGKYDFVFSLFNERKKRLFKSIEDKWRARAITRERNFFFYLLRCSHRTHRSLKKNWKNFSQSVGIGRHIHKCDFCNNGLIKLGSYISTLPKTKQNVDHSFLSFLLKISTKNIEKSHQWIYCIHNYVVTLDL